LAHHYGDFMRNRLPGSEKTKNKEKEKTMATTIKELTVHLDRQQEEITQLRTRLSTLVDELHTTRSELNSFKTKVASDMQLVSKNVRANMRPV
jgi:predicted RNase H-like nuclease (RuvC/YqgF family)